MFTLTLYNLLNIRQLFNNFAAIEGVRFSATAHPNNSKVYDGGTSAEYNQNFAIKLYYQLSLVNIIKVISTVIYFGEALYDFHRLVDYAQFYK